MLYRLLKLLFIPTYRAYFRSLIINNKEGIPKKGPLVVAVNHTSAFMDPILVAITFDRVFHFLARGEAFNSKFAKAFYSKINMLPLYRPETMPEETHKNKFVFQKCYDHLKNGKAIMMFPEGFSKTERNLRPIKTGLARMVLGAEADDDFKLGIKVLAIGLNYSDPHIFRSDVFINVSDTLNASDYEVAYKENPKKAVNLLTEDIRKKMQESTVVIGDERTDVFVSNIEKLVQYDLEKNELGLKRFESTKELAEKMENLARNNKAKYEEIEMRLSNYVQRLKRLGIKEKRLFQEKIKTSFISNVSILVLGFPLFLLGAFFNIIPFYITGYVSRNIQVRDDFIGSLKSVAGMFLFLIFYLIYAIFFGLQTTWYGGILLFLTLYPLGILSLSYLNLFLNLIEDYRHTRIFHRKATFMEDLRTERKQILSSLDLDL